MRLVFSLVAASILGSGLVGGVKFLLSDRSSNPYPDLLLVYKEDRANILSLLEEASISCVPQLKEIRSRAVRGLLARTLVFSIETRGAPGGASKRAELKQKLSKITDPVMRNASKADFAIMKDFMQRPDMSEAMSCIVRAAVETSKSRREVSRRLLQDVEMRW